MVDNRKNTDVNGETPGNKKDAESSLQDLLGSRNTGQLGRTETRFSFLDHPLGPPKPGQLLGAGTRTDPSFMQPDAFSGSMAFNPIQKTTTIFESHIYHSLEEAYEGLAELLEIPGQSDRLRLLFPLKPLPKDKIITNAKTGEIYTYKFSQEDIREICSQLRSENSFGLNNTLDRKGSKHMQTLINAMNLFLPENKRVYLSSTTKKNNPMNAQGSDGNPIACYHLKEMEKIAAVWEKHNPREQDSVLGVFALDWLLSMGSGYTPTQLPENAKRLEEIAEEEGVHEIRLNRLIREGQLDAVNIGQTAALSQLDTIAKIREALESYDVDKIRKTASVIFNYYSAIFSVGESFSVMPDFIARSIPEEEHKRIRQMYDAKDKKGLTEACVRYLPGFAVDFYNVMIMQERELAFSLFPQFKDAVDYRVAPEEWAKAKQKFLHGAKLIERVFGVKPADELALMDFVREYSELLQIDCPRILKPYEGGAYPETEIKDVSQNIRKVREKIRGAYLLNQFIAASDPSKRDYSLLYQIDASELEFIAQAFVKKGILRDESSFVQGILPELRSGLSSSGEPSKAGSESSIGYEALSAEFERQKQIACAAGITTSGDGSGDDGLYSAASLPKNSEIAIGSNRYVIASDVKAVAENPEIARRIRFGMLAKNYDSLVLPRSEGRLWTEDKLRHELAVSEDDIAYINANGILKAVDCIEEYLGAEAEEFRIFSAAYLAGQDLAGEKRPVYYRAAEVKKLKDRLIEIGPEITEELMGLRADFEAIDSRLGISKECHVYIASDGRKLVDKNELYKFKKKKKNEIAQAKNQYILQKIGSQITAIRSEMISLEEIAAAANLPIGIVAQLCGEGKRYSPVSKPATEAVREACRRTLPGAKINEADVIAYYNAHAGHFGFVLADLSGYTRSAIASVSDSVYTRERLITELFGQKTAGTESIFEGNLPEVMSEYNKRRENRVEVLVEEPGKIFYHIPDMGSFKELFSTKAKGIVRQLGKNVFIEESQRKAFLAAVTARDDIGLADLDDFILNHIIDNYADKPRIYDELIGNEIWAHLGASIFKDLRDACEVPVLDYEDSQMILSDDEKKLREYIRTPEARAKALETVQRVTHITQQNLKDIGFDTEKGELGPEYFRSLESAMRTLSDNIQVIALVTVGLAEASKVAYQAMNKAREGMVLLPLNGFPGRYLRMRYKDFANPEKILEKDGLFLDDVAKLKENTQHDGLELFGRYIPKDRFMEEICVPNTAEGIAFARTYAPVYNGENTVDGKSKEKEIRTYDGSEYILLDVVERYEKAAFTPGELASKGKKADVVTVSVKEADGKVKGYALRSNIAEWLTKNPNFFRDDKGRVSSLQALDMISALSFGNGNNSSPEIMGDVWDFPALAALLIRSGKALYENNVRDAFVSAGVPVSGYTPMKSGSLLSYQPIFHIRAMNIIKSFLR
ncbi:hypothetical protein J4206_01350 [Candidatus Woesearchaeota archaeon]|nr:hypothetical protein [Candidatus Woesearchaeota archaeon]